MNIIYNGTDITSSVQPVVLQITDNAGGKPDSVTVEFSDTRGLWSQWRPAKNDTLQIKHGGFDSGMMFIDELLQRAGTFELKALSIPQNAKSARSQGWEEVRFLEIATQLAARYGFILQTYNVSNHLYKRVDQTEEADFSFLAGLCLLEGYAVKINNRSLVIYDERQEEQRESTPLQRSQINGKFEFRDKSTDIYAKSIVRSQTRTGFIQGEFIAPNVFGPTIQKNLYATNQAEANRWARGILRSFNKYMVTGAFSINLNTNLAAGSNIEIRDIGMFDGRYFIHQLIHDLLGNQTRLTLRKPLGGY